MEYVKRDEINVYIKCMDTYCNKKVLTDCCYEGCGKSVMDDVKREKCVHKVDGHMHKNKSTYSLLLSR